ncbi:MAG: histidine--tRNA ligase [Candidatus Dormibacteraeota bacterium]|uniref:Histidine--tRNA ligase n=2 Tax=Candidatus Aeolococcaceae TaxID=3127005 RepID=A0A934K2I8_9BACT|nr:histidine--tRNA ligase [Candidatus Dormibacteraeota bacterium]MBJ7610238.1 histidine--tRNA ligase [Candidatus Dormibacteraeota bacterium]
MTPIAPPRGTKDLLPDEAPAWEWLHRAHAAVAARFGYQLIDTPIFESTELFARGVGSGTDIVDKEMYTFTDRGGRSVTLRPEGTAPVVRAVLGAHLDQRWRPVRVHYAMPMFRYDRPQAGRLRQHAQVGVEVIGERDPGCDAEVIEVAWRFIADLGIDGVSLQLNTLGDKDDRLGYRQSLLAYYTPLRDSLCEDCRRRLDVNPLRLLDCKKDAHHVENAPLLGDHLSAPSREHFAAVTGHLGDAEIPFTHNQRLVRGLDYYAHTAFEFWHTSLAGAQNALGGGGRYDGLAEQLGFAPTPGVGHALGVERLLTVAVDQGIAPRAGPPAQVVICTVGEESAATARTLARQLRDRTSVVSDVSDRRLDRKLRDAGRSDATLALLVGMDEGLVLRNLRTRQQQVTTSDRVLDAVSAELLAAAQDPRT